MTLRYVAIAAALAGPTDPPDTENQPFWSGHPDAPTFERAVDARLDHARDLLARLVGVKGQRTVANTLVPYDRLMRELDRAASATGLIQKVHPDTAMREAADRGDRKVSALATEISLDRRVFEAVRAMDLSGADSVTRHYVGRILRDFRLAGVDRDSATRARIKALREELVVIGQEFDRNISNDVRTVEVGSAAQLAGLPDDYIAAHPPGPDGRIRITTEYPDVFPVFTYARSDELRRRLRAEFDNRAYPANLAVLDRMIARRHELARLLGFESWADYALADKMTGSAANASAFIDRVVAASGEAAEREYQTLLSRKRQDDPVGLRLRLAKGAALLPLPAGEAGRARPLGAALRRDLPPDERPAGVGPVGRRLGDVRGRQAGWTLLPRHAPAAGQVRSRGPFQDPYRHDRRRAARVGAGLQLSRRRS